jgi:exopolyphosphatase/guanosine-5'-triphosphate,3'-diphosphate pyrophosphatase
MNEREIVNALKKRRLDEARPWKAISSDYLTARELLSLIGIGGTVRALARHDQHLRDYPLNKLHNYELSAKSVLSIHKKLRSMDAKEIAHLPSFGKDRAESVTAGSLVVSMLMETLGFDKVVVSTHGLRDGVLAEYLRRPTSRAKGELTEAVATELLASWNGNKPWNLNFTRSLTSIGIFSPAERRILNEAAASFFDVYFSTRSENLFYSILNEDSHLDHRDQLALALAMVQAKAPKVANSLYPKYYSLLKDESKGSIDILGAFIRLMSVLRLTSSVATARLRGRRLRLAIASPQREFPELLLDQAVKDVEDATELRVTSVLVRRSVAQEVSEVVRR